MILIFEGTDVNVGAFLKVIVKDWRQKGMHNSAYLIQTAIERGKGMAAVPKCFADFAERAAADIFQEGIEKMQRQPVDVISPNANEEHLIGKIETRYANDPTANIPDGAIFGPLTVETEEDIKKRLIITTLRNIEQFSR